MSQNSKIEWTTHTWPIVAGCDYASAGCANCYAVRDSWRMAHNPNPKISNVYAGTVDKRNGRLRWTGSVRPLPERLDWPRRWKKPARVFVCNMGDLFHPDVPEQFLYDVWRVMGEAYWHTFQVLTKRPERMREFVGEWLNRHRRTEPLDNVWLGISAENQEAADERIPVLMRTPAMVRYASVEPMLGSIDMARADDWLYCKGHFEAIRWRTCFCGLDWIIMGCESGPRRRPMELGWAQSLVEQCKAAGVPVFVKQLPVNGRVSHDPAEWPEDLRVREFPDVS